jgi:uncharacterized protein
MVTIPKEVQDFLPGKMGWVATVGTDGMPNVTPKGSVRLLDGEHLLFADLFSLKTRANLEHNPKIAVTVIEPGTPRGYQIKGTAEMIDAGPLFEETAAFLKEKNPALPRPKCVVKITVESVFDQSVGPNAGKQIA